MKRVLLASAMVAAMTVAPASEAAKRPVSLDARLKQQRALIRKDLQVMRWARNHKIRVIHNHPKPGTAEAALKAHIVRYRRTRIAMRRTIHLIQVRDARIARAKRLAAERARARALANSPYGRILAEANRINALTVPYRYGGGHWTPAPMFGPWDCSSAVSRVLQAAGFGIPTMTSGSFMYWAEPGVGRYVTVMANYGHVYLVIGGRPWGTSRLNPYSSPGWLPNGVQGYPYRYGFVARHPRGL